MKLMLSRLVCRLLDRAAAPLRAAASGTWRALALGAAAALTFTPCASAPSAAAGAFEQAPPLRLPGLDGKEVQIDYAAARITLVNFWATWCAPCKVEMPQINRLYLKFKDRGLQAVGVALQSGEPEEIREFLKDAKLEVEYPILIGTDELSDAYGQIEVVPTTHLIGPKGEVLKTYYGATLEFEKAVGAEIERRLAASGSGGPPAKRPSPDTPRTQGPVSPARPPSSPLNKADRTVLGALLRDWSRPLHLTSVDLAMANLGMPASKEARVRIGRHIQENPDLHDVLGEYGPVPVVTSREEKMILRTLIDRRASGEPTPTAEELAGLTGRSTGEVLDAIEILERLGLVAPDSLGVGVGVRASDSVSDSERPADLAATIVSGAGEKPFGVASLPEYLRVLLAAPPAGRVTIEGLCAHCASRVRIVMEAGAVVQPTSAAVILGGGRDDALFMSEAHALEWLETHPRLVGSGRHTLDGLLASLRSGAGPRAASGQR